MMQSTEEELLHQVSQRVVCCEIMDHYQTPKLAGHSDTLEERLPEARQREHMVLTILDIHYLSFEVRGEVDLLGVLHLGCLSARVCVAKTTHGNRQLSS